MKKRKIFLSLFSILLCATLMFTVFSSSSFKSSAAADVKLNGVNGKLRKFGESLIEALYDGNKASQSENDSAVTSGETVRLGGYPVGLKLYADGVVVVGTEAVDTADGNVDTAQKAGLRVGDIIKKIDGARVNTNSEVSDYIEKSSGKVLDFEIERDGEVLNILFKGAFSVSENRYKAGIWIRDSSAGIGTVSFCTRDGLFASLGHAVCDVDTKKVLPISQGECAKVNITGIVKGTGTTAGEMCGYLESESNGEVYFNGDLGVYGKFDTLPDTAEYTIARKNEVTTGEASIFTTLDDNVTAEYKIEIIGVDESNRDNKNLIINVTDNALLEKTGGIIQGMSGSPIVQNGKIVGAVTHVIIDDATKGYGVFAETMLEQLKNLG